MTNTAILGLSRDGPGRFDRGSRDAVSVQRSGGDALSTECRRSRKVRIVASPLLLGGVRYPQSWHLRLAYGEHHPDGS